MLESDESTRVILDPSFLFTDDGISWLEDAELRPFLAVSSALYERLGEPGIANILTEVGFETTSEMTGRIRELAESVRLFSHTEVPDLPLDFSSVRDALLSSGNPLAEMFADEWVFVKTQSIAILDGKNQRTLAAFFAAGGQVYMATREQIEKGLEGVRSRIPLALRNVMKSARRLADGVLGRGPLRVLMFAGSTVGIFVPAAGLPGYLIEGVLVGAYVIAGDP